VTSPFVRIRTTVDGAVPLRSVESIELTILVDCSIDSLMAGTDVAQQFVRPYEYFAGETLLAEHGFCVLATIRGGGETFSILYDAGLGRDTAVHNLDVLGVGIADLGAIVVSHGHSDHHGGLEGLVRRVGRRGMPIVLHPDAWKDRKIVFGSGAEVHLIPMDRRALEAEGVELIEERRGALLADGRVFVTGQVDRVTEFESGYPLHHANGTRGWEPDPWVWDDQAIVMRLAGGGLVVVSGCSHAGVINIAKYARLLSGEARIHALVGGLHLTGGVFDKRIPATLDALVELDPRYIAPGHCTGWKAIHAIAQRLPNAFVQTGVGMTLKLS
jgi:7,8-dihydropterin-6-yl-methyl-4-(beta-D-ribofuranosyl)aminobenzene 5'-phosphate synthase